MNITSQYAITIFRKNFDDRAVYTTTLTKTKADKTKEFGYIKCEFRKDVEVADKTKIYLTNAFLTFYKDKDSKTVPFIKILDFNTVEEEIKEAKKEADPFEKDQFQIFAKDNEEDINNLDLPF